MRMHNFETHRELPAKIMKIIPCTVPSLCQRGSPSFGDVVIDSCSWCTFSASPASALPPCGCCCCCSCCRGCCCSCCCCSCSCDGPAPPSTLLLRCPALSSKLV